MDGRGAWEIIEWVRIAEIVSSFWGRASVRVVRVLRVGTAELLGQALARLGLEVKLGSARNVGNGRKLGGSAGGGMMSAVARRLVVLNRVRVGLCLLPRRIFLAGLGTIEQIEQVLLGIIRRRADVPGRGRRRRLGRLLLGFVLCLGIRLQASPHKGGEQTGRVSSDRGGGMDDAGRDRYVRDADGMLLR